MKLSVYLADDHTIFVKTLANAVATFPNVSNVKTANSGRQLFKLVKETSPDVVVLDYEMPGWNGLQTADRIMQYNDRIKLILLSMHGNEELIITAINQGIHAFLLKNTEPEELQTAIDKVYLNDFYHNKVTTRALKKSAKEGPGKYYNISKREREVLLLICEELTMREIAGKLFLSEKTIQNHRQNLLKKMEVRNTAGLVKRAIELGIYIL